jgi:hypothetical protein
MSISPAEYLRLIITTNNMTLDDASKATGLMACTLSGILNGTVRVDEHNAPMLGRLTPPVAWKRYASDRFHGQKWRRIQQSLDAYNQEMQEGKTVETNESNKPSLEDKMELIVGKIREKIFSWGK